MSNGYDPILRQLTYVVETNTLNITIPGQPGDVTNWYYVIKVIDANGNLPSVNTSATPGGGNILATANPFTVAASNAPINVQFVFANQLPTGYAEIDVQIIAAFDVP